MKIKREVGGRKCNDKHDVAREMTNSILDIKLFPQKYPQNINMRVLVYARRDESVTKNTMSSQR